MDSTTQLTQSQTVILAASNLPESFTEAMLTVTAWKLDKEMFGLIGFKEDYPDHKRVCSVLMGERGLAKRGWLVKVGRSLYQLSRQGKAEAARIKGEAIDTTSPTILPMRRELAKIQAAAYTGAVLQRMLMSTAYRRYFGGQKTMIGYPEAFAFWGVRHTPQCKVADYALTIGLSEADAAFVDAENVMVTDEIILKDSSVVDSARLNRLREVHKYLQNVHLDRIRRHCIV